MQKGCRSNGQAFDDKDTATTSDDDAYMQAVAADSVTIGKTLDTTDDMARLTVVHSRAGVKKVRVYVLEEMADEFHHSDRQRWPQAARLTDLDAVAADTDQADAASNTLVAALKMKSLGMHYELANTDLTKTACAPMPLTQTLANGRRATFIGLDHTDDGQERHHGLSSFPSPCSRISTFTDVTGRHDKVRGRDVQDRERGNRLHRRHLPARG